MQIITRPKLLPPLALLRAATHNRPGTLSPMELRRIVADRIG
jgi:hypothetical protein